MTGSEDDDVVRREGNLEYRRSSSGKLRPRLVACPFCGIDLDGDAPGQSPARANHFLKCDEIDRTASDDYGWDGPGDGT